MNKNQNSSTTVVFDSPLYTKCNIISFVWLDIYVICGLVFLYHNKNPPISLNLLTSALPFLSRCTSLSFSLPPQPSIHSRQCVWNMIALVVIIGAFTLGIALLSTQYSD